MRRRRASGGGPRLGPDPASVRLGTFDAVVPARFRGASVPARSRLRRFRHRRRHGGGGLAGGAVTPRRAPRARAGRGARFGLRDPVDIAPVLIRRHDEDHQGDPDDREPNQNGNLRAPPERRRSLRDGL